MTVLVFVLFWILVGLGLLFVALSGGPRGARERLHSQSKTGQKLSYAGFAVALLVLGIAIPVSASVIVGNRDDIPEAGVTDLTAQEERGREIFGQRCRNCHALAAANASASVGPNLDQLRPTANLVKDAIENGRSRGNGQMAADLVVGEDVDAVAAFVAKAVGQTESEPGGEDPSQPAE